MERLLLMRHGDTDGTSKRRFMGKTDLPLSNKGIREAELLARRLRGEDISALYTSSLKRAVETARILNQFHNVPLREREAFEEIEFGRWEGLTLEEIYNCDRGLCKKWLGDVENFTMPGGESVRDMQRRVISGWKEISTRHRKGTVALVTHGGPIRVLICHILKIDFSFFWKIRQDTSSLNILTFSKGISTLTLLNDTCHCRKRRSP